MQSSEAFVTLEGQGLAHLGHLCGSPSQLCLESEEGCVRVPGHSPPHTPHQGGSPWQGEPWGIRCGTSAHSCCL